MPPEKGALVPVGACARLGKSSDDEGADSITSESVRDELKLSQEKSLVYPAREAT